MSTRVLVVDDDPLVCRAISVVLARSTCGLALVRELRHGDNVFVAVLTDDDDDDIRVQCHAGGADAVLIKPIAPVELRRRLTAAAVALKTLDAAS